MRKLWIASSISLLVVSGCTTRDNSASPSDTTITAEMLASNLVAYDSCDAMLDNIKADALSRVGPWGLEGDGGYSGDIAVRASSPDMAEMDSAPTAGAGDANKSPATTVQAQEPGVDFSTTNVQESGVDEPDVIKTDGKTLYVALDNELRLIDLSNGSPTISSTIALHSASSHQLLLDGNRLLVLSNGYQDAYVDDVIIDSEPAESGATGSGNSAGSDGSSSEPRTIAPGEPTTPQTTPPNTVPESTTTTAPVSTTTTQASTTPTTLGVALPQGSAVVTAFDVTDPTNAKLVAQTAVDGNLIDARMIDGTVRIITSSSPHNMDFVYPSSSGAAAEIRATKANREVIEDSTEADWLPSYTVTAGPDAGTEEKPLVGCASVTHTQESAGLGFLSVATLDLRGDAAIDPSRTVSVQTNGEDIYATTRTLYVATTTWNTDSPASATAIHAFDLSDPAAARYMGSGIARGTLLNQFSMSEFEGVLRVATTDWSTATATGANGKISSADDVGVAAPEPSQQSTESFVTTLRLDGGALVQVGQVGGLGRGEQIYSVRFLGTTGYVVTFRQTDPLYVVDLSNPSAPAVVGELKIPGYSSYLQPVGDGRLIGIGQDATDQGRTTGLQVALFDVSNPGDPRQIQKYALPGSTSEAERNHHAFLWWAPQNLLMIPVENWGSAGIDPLESSPSSAFVGAMGLNVTDGAISERGRITHPDTTGYSSYDGYGYPGFGNQIQRALVVGDSVLTISSSGVATTSITSFAPQSWLGFN